MTFLKTLPALLREYRIFVAAGPVIDNVFGLKLTVTFGLHRALPRLWSALPFGHPLVWVGLRVGFGASGLPELVDFEPFGLL